LARHAGCRHPNASPSLPFSATAEYGRSGQSHRLPADPVVTPSSAVGVAWSPSPGRPKSGERHAIAPGGTDERGAIFASFSRRDRVLRTTSRRRLKRRPRIEPRLVRVDRRVEGFRQSRLLAASRQQSKNYIGARPQQTTASPFNEHEIPAHGRVSRHLPWGSWPLGEISAVIVASVCLTAAIRSRSSSLPQRFHPTSTS